MTTVLVTQHPLRRFRGESQWNERFQRDARSLRGLAGAENMIVLVWQLEWLV